MNSGLKDNKPVRIGFRYAVNGVFHAFQKELNFKIHVFTTSVVCIAGFIFRLTMMEWAIILLTIGSVLSFELINTAMERAMDYLAPEIHPMVGLVKDLSAAAVLVAAIVSFIIGCLIFLPKIF
ncbi:diacylglycerol kinase family protein [Aquibacillus kalidii]|uniref:diacylglycerol kinase family protein n=1 Tax=Aquibacillus kalidii TaxID=2762597 RepID=UPI0016468E9D|nr:diacylglycerol kinase family protein [Aquibacillus kalidii]